MAGAAAQAEDIANKAANGELSVKGANFGGVNSVMTSGGGGGKAKAADNGFNMMNFGKFQQGGTAPALAKIDTMNFHGAREPSSASEKLLDNSDIWHSHWKGSIFNIISTITEKNRTRITEMEWQTPLNRALNGLSNVKKDGPPPPIILPKNL